MASTDPIGLAIIPADIPSSDEEVSACHHDTIDGVVDYQGLPAKRSQSGKWKSAYFIIGSQQPLQLPMLTCGQAPEQCCRLWGHLWPIHF